MSQLSEDVRAVYRAFGHHDLPYHEVAERLRYEQVKKKWPLLLLVQDGYREPSVEIKAGDGS